MSEAAGLLFSLVIIALGILIFIAIVCGVVLLVQCTRHEYYENKKRFLDKWKAYERSKK